MIAETITEKSDIPIAMPINGDKNNEDKNNKDKEKKDGDNSLLSLLTIVYFIMSMIVFNIIINNKNIIDQELYFWLYNNGIFIIIIMSVYLFIPFLFLNKSCIYLIFCIFPFYIFLYLGYAIFGTIQLYNGQNIINNFGPNCYNSTYNSTEEGILNCYIFNTFFKPLNYMLIVIIIFIYMFILTIQLFSLCCLPCIFAK